MREFREYIYIYLYIYFIYLNYINISPPWHHFKKLLPKVKFLLHKEIMPPHLEKPYINTLKTLKAKV
jgi:hypothetical protein